MEDNAELLAFRDKWKKELDSHVNETAQDSYEIYRQALYYEREGQPYEAVRYYRKAFKLNPELEFSREAQLKADFLPIHPNNNEESLNKKKDLFTDLQEDDDTLPDLGLLSLDSLAHIPVWAKEFHHSTCMKEFDLENDDLHITSLPPELMISIFRFLDAPSIDRCGAVCKYWFLLSRENDVWREICQRQWSRQIKTLAVQVKSQLGGNWRRLFLDKPRPRLDGVYISQNSYIRNGTKEGIFDLPVYKVIYWRYLRFFSDGTCVLCCTPDKPKVVVPDLVKKEYLDSKHPIEYGTYSIMNEEIISEGTLFIQYEKESEKDKPFPTQYCFILRLANSYSGWHNRLLVDSYYTEQNENKYEYPKFFVKTFKFIPVPKSLFKNHNTL